MLSYNIIVERIIGNYKNQNYNFGHSIEYCGCCQIVLKFRVVHLFVIYLIKILFFIIFLQFSFKFIFFLKRKRNGTEANLIEKNKTRKIKLSG